VEFNNPSFGGDLDDELSEKHHDLNISKLPAKPADAPKPRRRYIDDSPPSSAQFRAPVSSDFDDSDFDESMPSFDSRRRGG
jgi:hypothetical protein